MASFDLHDIFKRALLNGDAFRASNRTTLADGEEFIVHFSPSSDGGTFHIETPAISPDAAADIDVWENADPGSNAITGLLVHNMNYGVGEGDDEPTGTVTLVANGGLNTTGADQTEETFIRSGTEYNTPGGEEQRGLWRKVPAGENVTMVITDRSGGSNNEYSFDTVLYEGDTFPD